MLTSAPPSLYRSIASDGGWLRLGLRGLAYTFERCAARVRVDADVILYVSLVHILSYLLLALFTPFSIEKRVGYAAPMPPSSDTLSSDRELPNASTRMDVDPFSPHSPRLPIEKRVVVGYHAAAMPEPSASPPRSDNELPGGTRDSMDVDRASPRPSQSLSAPRVPGLPSPGTLVDGVHDVAHHEM